MDVKLASIHTLVEELKQRTVSMLVEAQNEEDLNAEEKLKSTFAALKQAEWVLTEYVDSR